jgi:hypothetical protein
MLLLNRRHSTLFNQLINLNSYLISKLKYRTGSACWDSQKPNNKPPAKINVDSNRISKSEKLKSFSFVSLGASQSKASKPKVFNEKLKSTLTADVTLKNDEHVQNAFLMNKVNELDSAIQKIAMLINKLEPEKVAENLMEPFEKISNKYKDIKKRPEILKTLPKEEKTIVAPLKQKLSELVVKKHETNILKDKENKSANKMSKEIRFLDI